MKEKPVNPALLCGKRKLPFDLKWSAKLEGRATLDELMELIGNPEFKQDLLASDETDDYEMVIERLLALEDDIDDVMYEIAIKELEIFICKMIDLIIKRNIRNELIYVRIFLLKYGNFIHEGLRLHYLQAIQPGIDGVSDERVQTVGDENKKKVEDIW